MEDARGRRMRPPADRSLVYGILALRGAPVGAGRDNLIDALGAWMADGEAPLGPFLVARGVPPPGGHQESGRAVRQVVEGKVPATGANGAEPEATSSSIEISPSLDDTELSPSRAQLDTVAAADDRPDPAATRAW